MRKIINRYIYGESKYCYEISKYFCCTFLIIFWRHELFLTHRILWDLANTVPTCSSIMTCSWTTPI